MTKRDPLNGCKGDLQLWDQVWSTRFWLRWMGNSLINATGIYGAIYLLCIFRKKQKCPCRNEGFNKGQITSDATKTRHVLNVLSFKKSRLPEKQSTRKISQSQDVFEISPGAPLARFCVVFLLFLGCQVFHHFSGCLNPQNKV